MAQLAVICGVKREALAALKGCLDISLLIYVTGARGGRGGELARSAIREGAEGLISFGTAGGLDPSLKPGDPIIPNSVRTPLGRDIPCDMEWMKSLRRRMVGEGPALETEYQVFGSQRLIDTPAKKANLFTGTGASAVDMESHEIAEAARAEGVPFVVARAVSDTSGTAIPEWVGAAVGGRGQVRAFSLIGGLLTHPGDFGALIRLGRESGPAFQTLGRMAGVLIPAFAASR